MRATTMMVLAGVGLIAAGCMTEETQRIDGMTPGAGNALAANTAMQMVDPWQYGVQDTDLEVPADRAGAVAKAPAADSSSEGGETSTGSGSDSGTSN